MTYNPQTWADGPSGGTPLTSSRLNHMEAGIAAAEIEAAAAGVAADALDARLDVIEPKMPSKGLFANMPPAGNSGKRYYATDLDKEYLDDGTTWHEMGASGGVRVWAANTAYKALQLVTYGTDLYQAKVDFTTGATFSATNWNAIGKSTYATILTPVETLTYNPDGTVASQTISGVATTYTYNTDGTVATETRAGVTRTYTYTGGNLTAVA